MKSEWTLNSIKYEEILFIYLYKILCDWVKNEVKESNTNCHFIIIYMKYMNKMFILKNIILVDPASSYMLVSKIKPCMSKYTRIKSETAKGSLYQLWFLRLLTVTWITVVILELIHAI